jgi:hypothetical protein
MVLSTRPAAHFKLAWQRFKRHPRPFLIASLALFASWAGLEIAVVALQRWGVALNIALHIGFLFLFSGLMVGVHRMALEVVEDRPATLRDLTASLGRAPTLLGAATLYALAVLAGFLLLVLPGVYVAVRYAFFAQVIAASDASAVDALRGAGALSAGRWGSMWLGIDVALPGPRGRMQPRGRRSAGRGILRVVPGVAPGCGEPVPVARTCESWRARVVEWP